MKLKLIFIFTLILGIKSHSQNSNNILFTIDGEPYYTNEFLAVYNKNLSVVADSEDNSIQNYLELFVNYKLKVKSAKDQSLDTLKSYKDELEKYKNSLLTPYLTDDDMTDNLVKEAYERLKLEINASHILMTLDADAKPADTLAAYNKMLEIRELILNGQDFDEVAKQYSQDPSAAKNGGKIGYFKGLQMVYPFEEVAYSTAVGEVSMPFKTKFGYHILKVNDVRVSEGEVEAAHIMLNGDTEAVKQKIDSIYKVLLKNPADFEKLAETLSDDKSSAKNGGYLAKFDYGRMVEEFSKVAFSLQNPGDISKPFKTSYGWHIIKLIKKYPVESFEVLEPKISQQIKRSDRAVLSEKSVIDGLRKKYKIVVFEPALNQFETDDWKANPEKFQQKLLKIQELDIYQSQFIAFLNKNNFKTVNSAFKAFEEQEILNYYKQDIQTNNAEFLATYKEFEEGLLLFSMLESEVWEKSKDSVGLQNYYEANKNGIFKNKNLEDNKGFIVSEYQNYLENAWIEALHQKYNVEFVETEKKYIIESNLN